MRDERGKSRDRLREESEALARRLIEDMSADGPDWVKSWRFPSPHNPLSGTRYRGRNNLLLLFCMRERGLSDPRFATFKQVKDHGMRVRKGASSFAVEHWSPVWVKVDQEGNSSRLPAPRSAKERALYEADPSVRVSGLRLDGHYSVFNGSDIEGMPPLEDTTPSLSGSRAIEFLEANSPCQVIERMGDEAYYSRRDDRIVLPLREQFSSAGSMARVLLHEQAHATGSPDRLAREKGGRFGDERYALEELVAEISSMMSANELGVELEGISPSSDLSGSDYWQQHVAYVKSWASRLDGEDTAEVVMRAAGMAGRATDWLMENCFRAPLDREREPHNERLKEIARRLDGETRKQGLQIHELTKEKTEPVR